MSASVDFKNATAGPPSADNSSWAPCSSLAKGGGRKGDPEAGVQEGERWSSATASVYGRGIARAGFIPAPYAAASRPGSPGCTAQGGGALSSQAEGGQSPTSMSPRSASRSAYILFANEASTGGSFNTAKPMMAMNTNQVIPLCTCKCGRCSELNSLACKKEEDSCASDMFDILGKQMPMSMSMSMSRDRDQVRGLIKSEADEVLTAYTKEADPRSTDQRRYPLGSNYWEHYPTSEDLNPAGFYSPHPLWEGFAIPARLKNKRAFHCVFCGKKFLGSADKGVQHMKSQGCLIPDADRQILWDKLDAYCKRKQDLLNQRPASSHDLSVKSSNRK